MHDFSTAVDRGLGRGDLSEAAWQAPASFSFKGM
jgi:hypothetical protein